MEVDSSDERDSGDKSATFTVLLHGSLKVEQMVALVQIGLVDISNFCLVTATTVASVVHLTGIFGPRRWSQNTALVVFVLLVVVISSLKIPKAFLMCSAAQRNFAYTSMLIFPTDLPSQIFLRLISN